MRVDAKEKPHKEFFLWVIKRNINSDYVLDFVYRDEHGYTTNGDCFEMRDQTSYFNGWSKFVSKYKFGESLITNDYQERKELQNGK